MPRQPKWTEDDVSKLVNRVRELRLKDFKPSLLVLINQAQEELIPTDRRKILKALENAKVIVEKLEMFPVPVPVPVPVSVSVPVSAPDATIAISINPAQILEILKDQTEMMELVFYQINDILNLVKAKPVVETKRAVLKRVLIIGLLNQQANIVRETTKSFAKLSFLDTDKAIKSENYPICDHIIMMKKFISHAVETTVKKTGIKYVLHEGGIKTLVQRIKEL
jgi:hypothetical protein